MLQLRGGAVVMAGPAGAAEEVEEKTEFNVMLDEVPADKKIAVLKVVRSFNWFRFKRSKRNGRIGTETNSRSIWLKMQQKMLKKILKQLVVKLH